MPSRRAVDVTPFANFLAVQGDGHRLINGVDSVKIGGPRAADVNAGTVLYRRLNQWQVQRLEFRKRLPDQCIFPAFSGQGEA